MEQEFQIMLVSSWLDGVVRLATAVSLLLCMYDIKTLITSEMLRSSVARPHVIFPVNDARTNDTQHTLVCPIEAQGSDFRLVKVKIIVEKFSPKLLVVWGIVVVVLHFVAYIPHISDSNVCPLHLRPWFTLFTTCALVKIDCHAIQQETGRLHTPISVWRSFGGASVARLEIQHCRQLEMPSVLRDFSQVIPSPFTTPQWWRGVEKRRWLRLPILRSVAFVRTNFSGSRLPVGLIIRDFPPRVNTLLLRVLNLRELPSDLHERWPLGMQLAFEATQITELPRSISLLAPSILSLASTT